MDCKIIYLKKISVFCIIILCSTFLSAQNCENYGTKCDLTDNAYTKGSISQGFKIPSGKSVSVSYTFYEGKENYLSVCGETDAGAIEFMILTSDGQDVLFDNTNDNNRQSISLKVKVTTKVIIKMSAPQVKYASKSKCVGLLVAYLNLK